MFTTRISPKMSVNPLATTKYTPAAVNPLSSVMTKSWRLSTAEPNAVCTPVQPNSEQGSAAKTIQIKANARRPRAAIRGNRRIQPP